MLRECLARRPRAAAVGSLVLSTVLVAGISAACEKSQAAIDEAPASTGSLPAEPPTGPLCTVKDSRSAKQFPRLAYPPRVGRTDASSVSAIARRRHLALHPRAAWR